MGINNRFNTDTPIMVGANPVVPVVIAQSCVETTTGDAETVTITGSSITVPKGFFRPGCAFRFTIAGSRSGTAGAMTLLIVIGSTTVISIALPSNTATDYVAQFIIMEHTNFKNQKCFGMVFQNGQSVAQDYATATVDVSDEIVIKAQMTNANASDDIYAECVLVENWTM
jgi:hypothetical protein